MPKTCCRAARCLHRARRALPTLLVLALLGLPCAVVTPPARAADAGTKKKQDEERPSVGADAVYLGNATRFAHPAEVDADAVYREIPAYKKILEDDIEPGSPAYELQMDKASRTFKTALRKVAKQNGYDLVARLGSVRGVADVPDISQSVIDAL